MRKSSLAILLAATGLAGALPALSQTLPNGNGKDVVATACTVCHEAGRITNAGHTREEWDTVVHNMIMMGAVLKPEQIALVTNYLASNLPPKAKANLPTIAGNVQANFREFKLPTRAFPHDPYAAPDGAIWYTGQLGNVLGRVDPKTGQVKDYPLPPSSGPHGLMGDKDGNIWFTGNFKGYIGKLDPKSGQFTEYRLPDPKARDPHTPIFDKTGNLWFTVQGGNMIGRLIPATGEIKLVEAPTPKSLPYGTVIDSKNKLWIVLFGTNKIASVDNNMKVTEYSLPSADARPRRLAIDADDVIWYSDFSRGYLGKFDTKTGKFVKEYLSPSGPKSEPYGITVIDGIVWYNEGNAKPNGLVRFDPKSESFQSFPIPSGGGVVRNMMPTADKKGIVMAESAQNKVAIATIQ